MKRMTVTCLTSLFAVCLFLPGFARPEKYEPNWESLDKRETPEWFKDAKFGIFIHWGLYSVPSWGVPGEYSEWYWRRMYDRKDDNPWWQYHKKMYGEDFPYKSFAPLFKAELFNPDHWAEVFKRSGAKYVVLTSKHHEGFTLWPNQLASRHWGQPWNAMDIGPRRDLLGDLTQSVRDAGIKMGYYYSFYEWFNPLWLADRDVFVREHMIPQFKELVTEYKPDIIWCDGEWDMPPEQWKAPELLAWLYNDSPVGETIVVNDRWGKGSRHNHGGYFTTEYGAGLSGTDKPWEECRGMAHSFGYNQAEPLDTYKSSREMLMVLVDLVSRGGCLLLDIGPDGHGSIPLIMEQRLLEMGEWLDVNGEAIFDTRPWIRDCQWSDGKRPDQEYGEYKVKYNVMNSIGKAPVEGRAVKQAFFTKKEDAVYAITPYWPGREMVLKDMKLSDDGAVTLLGVEDHLKWKAQDGNLVIAMPQLEIDEAPCRWAYTFKLEGVQ